MVRMRTIAFIFLTLLLGCSLWWAIGSLSLLVHGYLSWTILFNFILVAIAIGGMIVVNKTFPRTSGNSSYETQPTRHVWPRRFFTGGLVFAFAPLLVSVTLSPFGEEYSVIAAMGIITFPIGLIVSIVSGITIWIQRKRG